MVAVAILKNLQNLTDSHERLHGDAIRHLHYRQLEVCNFNNPTWRKIATSRSSALVTVWSVTNLKF